MPMPLRHFWYSQRVENIVVYLGTVYENEYSCVHSLYVYMTIACYERLSVAFPLFVKLIYLRNIHSSIFVHTSIYILNNVLILLFPILLHVQF